MTFLYYFIDNPWYYVIYFMIFTQPRILACLHVFCEACLGNNLNGGEGLEEELEPATAACSEPGTIR